MLFFKIFIFLTLALYAGYMLFGAIGFFRANHFESKSNILTTKTCIIISARNEEKTIQRCLTSILEQDFDKSLLELIIVDDASEDATSEIANSILSGSGIIYSLIRNPQKLGKKRSITKAIESCQSELIISRDADTYTIGSSWLKNIVAFYETHKKEFIIAPLEIENNGGILVQLQSYENTALAILAGGYAFYNKPFLCNGANLAFTKTLFQDLNGYRTHEHIASGDDVLFMEEVKKIRPETIGYLKHRDSVVITYPLNNLRSLIFQKLRWSQKSFFNPNNINLLMGAAVISVHLLSLYFICHFLVTGQLEATGIIFISGRFFIDFLLLFLASGYFNKPVKWLWFFPLSFFYSLYVLVIMLLSLFIKPNWK